jgi:CDP-glucose 4,6-dehydratase
LLLAEKLCSEPAAYSDGWNIGPAEGDAKPVEWIVDRICSLWGETAKWELDGKPHPHEAHYLKLDCSKARHELGWSPRWTLEQCLEHLVHWYRSWLAGRDMRDVSLEQLRQFIGATYVEKV